MTRLGRITEKIDRIVGDKSHIVTAYTLSDTSVQAQIRLSTSWSITLSAGSIAYPRQLSEAVASGDEDRALWQQMRRLDEAIREAAQLGHGGVETTINCNARRKNGPAMRDRVKRQWSAEAGSRFLREYRAATLVRRVALATAKIVALQAEQRALLPQLRAANSRYLAGLKTAREEQVLKNATALQSGRFWEANAEAIKKHFHPPFGKNYLADVSARWRAALFLECESVSYKRGDGSWGHKLAGTDRGYLCGIDDNGEEWGRGCRINLHSDDYGDLRLHGTVAEAMAALFDVPISCLDDCQRQGDLLFRRLAAPPDVALQPATEWIPRDPHTVTSPGLQHNGNYLASGDAITVSHPSHPVLTLEPGAYRLYLTSGHDAD